jgi:hypothetical protein
MPGMKTFTLIFDSIAKPEIGEPKYRFMAKRDGHEDVTSLKRFSTLGEAVLFARHLSLDGDALRKMEAALSIDETFIVKGAAFSDERLLTD